MVRETLAMSNIILVLWSLWYHLKSFTSKITYHCALCDIGFTFSHWMKKRMKLNIWRVHIGVLFVVNDSSSGKINSNTWRVMLGDNPCICALCNQELISRNYQQRHNTGHNMEYPYPCGLCFKEFISINHPNIHTNMNTGKFNITVCLISKNYCKK